VGSLVGSGAKWGGDVQRVYAVNAPKVRSVRLKAVETPPANSQFPASWKVGNREAAKGFADRTWLESPGTSDSKKKSPGTRRQPGLFLNSPRLRWPASLPHCRSSQP
jgi:hypothetical protein